MKTKILIIGLVGLVSANTVFAQKGELNNAKDQYNKYQGIRGQKTFAAMATTAINEAKASIDKAAANEKTAKMPLTYAVKGGIYAALAYRDTTPATQTPLFATADEALKNAQEGMKTVTNADDKAEIKKIIDDATQTMIVIKYNVGVKQFTAGKYDAAYQSFEYFRSARHDDTTELYLPGLTATNSKMYDEGIKNYTKLLSTNYSKNPSVYADLSYIYLNQKDTVNALKIVGQGAAKYPNDGGLAKREIELSLQTGKTKEVAQKIEAAIAADPKNKVLYYYAGLVYYDQGNIAKAEASYRKATEIDPNYFEAFLNLGSTMIRPGLDMYNSANKLPASKQKEYDEQMKKAGDVFEGAKPVLLRAVELRPTSYEALFNLRAYYVVKHDAVNVNATQKRMDAVRK